MANRTDMPLVTILIAMRNEAGFVRQTLESVFAQDYPQALLEVMVADGGSRDTSKSIVAEMFAGRPNCHLFDNHRRTAASGWNEGMRRARGDVMTIVSAHCELDSGYVSTAVATLHRTRADLVGGPMRAVGHGHVGRAIALATSSPFGVGDARFHYTDREEEVDTVYQGFFRRSLVETIGLFDESMDCNEDDEFSFRIKKNGGHIVCNPAIRSRYHSRATLRSLWRQYLRYGYWKVRLIRGFARQMSRRHFVPAAAVLTGVLLAAAGFAYPACWFVLGSACTAYAVCALVATAALARNGISASLIVVPIVFPVLHLAYGTGFLGGLAAWLVRRPAMRSFQPPVGGRL